MNKPEYKVSSHQTRLHPEPGLREIIAEIRDEAASFVDTRIRMVKAELRESLGAIKFVVPLGVIALGLFATAGLLFTSAAVALVASAFAGSPYAWIFASLIVGVAWILLCAAAAYFAAMQFRGRFPKRTLEVLKADKAWLQKEARSQL